MLTSWTMITSKVIYKMAKHVAIINWNFWNLPIVPLLRTPLQGLLSNSRLRSYVDQSWSSDTIASSSGWLISRCLCFDSSFSCLCNHLWYCEPKFLFFFLLVKLFSSVESIIFPNQMTCSILSAIVTRPENIAQSFQPGSQSTGPWKCWKINWSSPFPTNED
jgi:hypothetical protein